MSKNDLTAEYWKACLIASQEATESGVYPAAIEKDGVKTERSEWQDGWNAAVSKQTEMWYAFFDKCEEATDLWQMQVVMAAKDTGFWNNDKYYANVNDIFAWGCADAEEVSDEDLPIVFAAFQSDRKWGVIKWACQRRNEQPQSPVARDMQTDGVWDEAMNTLPENDFDKKWRKHRATTSSH